VAGVTRLVGACCFRCRWPPSPAVRLAAPPLPSPRPHRRAHLRWRRRGLARLRRSDSWPTPVQGASASDRSVSGRGTEGSNPAPPQRRVHCEPDCRLHGRRVVRVHDAEREGTCLVRLLIRRNGLNPEGSIPLNPRMREHLGGCGSADHPK
jgi:hypothetical protein